MTASVNYSYERIADPEADAGFHFRVRDADDNRVATCWDERNAFMVTEALNYRADLKVHWTCGHIAKGVCAECDQELRQKLNALQAEVDELEEELFAVIDDAIIRDTEAEREGG